MLDVVDHADLIHRVPLRGVLEGGGEEKETKLAHSNRKGLSSSLPVHAHTCTQASRIRNAAALQKHQRGTGLGRLLGTAAACLFSPFGF